MKLKRDILQVLFGAIFIAGAMHFGILKSTNPFWDNVIGGIAVLGASKFLAWIFG